MKEKSVPASCMGVNTVWALQGLIGWGGTFPQERIASPLFLGQKELATLIQYHSLCKEQ